MKYNLNSVVAERKTKTVYKDNGVVIKLFVEGYKKSAILNEALNQARVEENTSLNIPKLKEVTTIGDRWALCSEYIEGKTLAELMEENPEKQYDYIEEFVKLQLEVLKFNVPHLKRIKDKIKKKINDSNLIDESTKYELLHRLEGMKNHTKLCHGDFNPSNVVVASNGQYYILDWAHATQGNSSADAARTFLIFSMQGKNEIAEKYLNLFSELSGIEKQLIQTWIPIVAGVQLTEGKEDEEFLKTWINVADYV